MSCMQGNVCCTGLKLYVGICRSVLFTFSTASGSTGGVKFECALTAAKKLTGGPPSPAPATTAGAASPAGLPAGPPDAAQFKPCSSPASFDNLADGGYQFYVRAKGEQVADSRSFMKVPILSFGRSLWQRKLIHLLCSNFQHLIHQGYG